jgi:sulfoxide reductase heme-binding subunit YedZ
LRPRRPLATKRRRQRLVRRLLRHHLPLAIGTAAASGWLATIIGSPSDARTWSLATAYVGLTLLVAALLIGPLMILRDRRLAVSNDLRRDVGIWAGFIGFAHVAFGLQVHLGGDVVRYFAAGGLSLRTDLFGLANHTGLVATLMLLALVATSSDQALSLLGARRWKRMHRLSYLLFALVVGHGLIYGAVENRTGPTLWLLVGVGLLTAAVQLAGFGRRRAQLRGARRAVECPN